jgi:hypothetical protein
VCAASQSVIKQQELKLHCGQGINAVELSDITRFIAASIRMNWSVLRMLWPVLNVFAAHHVRLFDWFTPV